MIQTENLSFLDFLTFPDLTIHSGRATFLWGESGSGKSTLLKLLNATLTPSSGRILYDGRERADYLTLRREFLLCGQSVWLFPKTIRENFRLFYEYLGLPCPDNETMKTFLSVCLADFSPESDCSLLSGGERQRVFSAIFLSFLPKVFMLDEPTAALDAALADTFLGNIKDFCLKNGVTPIVVSHDQFLRDKYADTIIEVKKEWAPPK